VHDPPTHMRRTVLLALTLVGVFLGGMALRQGWFRQTSKVVRASDDQVAGAGEPAPVKPNGADAVPPVPEAARQGKQPVEEIVGIGTALEWDKETNCPKIRHIVPNSPAASGGLMAGWLISRIDGEPTTGLKLAECVHRIQGPAGSKVRLELVHLEEQATNQVELVRQKIQIQARQPG
jgi:hypothetical protein